MEESKGPVQRCRRLGSDASKARNYLGAQRILVFLSTVANIYELICILSGSRKCMLCGMVTRYFRAFPSEGGMVVAKLVGVHRRSLDSIVNCVLRYN